MEFFSFLKNKKALTLALLFLVVAGIVAPQLAFAGGSWWNPANWIDNAVNTTLNALIIFSVSGPLLLIVTCSSVARVLFVLVITYATGLTKYTSGPAVEIGWPIMRNLANMIIVLGFLVIAISTALRFKDYEAKQLLWKLIVVAFLVNFSLMLCGLFIDATNIIMNVFFKTVKLGNFNTWIPAFTEFFSLVSNISASNILEFTPKLIALMSFHFIAFFVYFLYGTLILGRILAIWMLVILSPLAFVCYVFPATKRVWSMWWSNFFQWCIIVLPAGLFFYIGSQLIKVFPAVDITKGDIKDYISNSLETIYVPGMFLILGFMISLQFSAMGSNLITGFAKKNIGKAMGIGAKTALGAAQKSGGWVGKGAQWLDSKTGGYVSRMAGAAGSSVIGKAAGSVAGAASAGVKQVAGLYKAGQETVDKRKSAFNRTLEGFGLAPVGGAAGKEDKELSAAIAALTAALKSGKKEDEQRVFDKLQNGTAVEKSAALHALNGEGKLHEAFRDSTGKTDYNAMQEAVVAAEKSGAKPNLRKDIESKYADFAEYNPKNINSALNTLGHKGAIDTELTSKGIDTVTATAAQRVEAAQDLETRGSLATGTIKRAHSKAKATKLMDKWGGMNDEERSSARIEELDAADFEEFMMSRNANDVKVWRSLDPADPNKRREKVKNFAANMRTEAARGGVSKNKKNRLEETADELDTL